MRKMAYPVRSPTIAPGRLRPSSRQAQLPGPPLHWSPCPAPATLPLYYFVRLEQCDTVYTASLGASQQLRGALGSTGSPSSLLLAATSSATSVSYTDTLAVLLTLDTATTVPVHCLGTVSSPTAARAWEACVRCPRCPLQRPLPRRDSLLPYLSINA